MNFVWEKEWTMLTDVVVAEYINHHPTPQLRDGKIHGHEVQKNERSAG